MTMYKMMSVILVRIPIFYNKMNVEKSRVLYNKMTIEKSTMSLYHSLLRNILLEYD